MHRALGRRPPAEAFAARAKATPKGVPLVVPAHYRVRRDKVDKTGRVTLRYRSRLLHLAVGRAHTGTRVLMLVRDLEVRVISEDGELLSTVIIDPRRDYQPKAKVTARKAASQSPQDRSRRPGRARSAGRRAVSERT